MEMANPNCQPEPAIYHFSHPHPLQLSNYHQSQQTTSCSGCLLKASGWMYICIPCNYLLHVSCSQMPQQMNHPIDKSHALTLLPKPIYPGGLFNCDACGKQSNGFSYHCGECNIDLHLICASLPLVLTHQAHHHPLNLTFSPPYNSKSFSCDLCKKLGSSQWLYGCSLCEFDAHLGCATTQLPKQNPVQPYQLTAPRVQNPVQTYQLTAPRVFTPFPPSPHQVLGTQLATAPPLNNYLPNQRAINNHGRGNGVLNQTIQGLFSATSQTLGQNLVQGLLGGGGGGGGLVNGVSQTLGKNLVQVLLGDSGGGDGGDFTMFNEIFSETDNGLEDQQNFDF